MPQKNIQFVVIHQSNKKKTKFKIKKIDDNKHDIEIKLVPVSDVYLNSSKSYYFEEEYIPREHSCSYFYDNTDSLQIIISKKGDEIDYFLW